MSAPQTDPCDVLAWDTDFFSRRIGRVRGDRLAPGQAGRIDEWCEQHGIECLYFLARSDDPSTVAAAEAGGFSLVDLRLTLGRAAIPCESDGIPNGVDPKSIRPFRAKDLKRLRDMAGAVHVGTRFSNDPNFPRRMVQAFYSAWIELECGGRAKQVFVAVSPEDLPLGYISCHGGSDGAGQIGLLGVSAEERGRGLGEALVRSALGWFAERGCREATVVTQAANIPAQRLYQKCRFLSRDLQLWYHKWYPRSKRAHA